MKTSLLSPLVGILTLIPLLSVSADQDNTKVEGSLKDVQWGDHWAGPEIKVSDLRGKVVLLKIWGG
ncbi:MAG: hypothetical protein ACKVHP_24660 [Verrucomicrobiales bacterium]|jgi:hypothetical protein